MTFAYLRDPLFLCCVGAYGINRTAEDFGWSHWFLRGYLNDLLCMGFWMPILMFGLRGFGLRASNLPPTKQEIAIAFLVWSTMFEVWLPSTRRFAGLTISDPWDIVCYAAGGILASLWWTHYYTNTIVSPAHRFRQLR